MCRLKGPVMRIIFVCLGNICRSPTAEGVFTKLVQDRQFTDRFHIDSAGTHAYHVGNSPDGRAQQTAKQRGIKTINVVRREGLADELLAKGGDVVLIDGPDLAEKIARAAGKEPVALALDAVGGDTYTRLMNSLGYGGTIVAYGMLSGKPATLNTGMTIFKDIRNRGFWLQKWYENATLEEKQAAFGKIIPLIATGVLKADVDSRFTVDNIKAAVTRAGEGGRNGKVLIVPSPL